VYTYKNNNPVSSATASEMTYIVSCGVLNSTHSLHCYSMHLCVDDATETSYSNHHIVLIRAFERLIFKIPAIKKLITC